MGLTKAAKAERALEAQRKAESELKRGMEDARFQGLYSPSKIDMPAALKTLSYGEVYPAWCFNVYTGSVSRGCFSSIYHSRTQPDKTSTQTQGGPWYETRAEALKALRDAMACEFFKKLYEVDKQIVEATLTKS